jgi:Domain of unknown function (DUF4329)
MTHNTGLILIGPVLAFLAACAQAPVTVSGGRNTSFDGPRATVATTVGSRGDQRLLGGLATGPRAPSAEATGTGAERAAAEAILTDLQLASFAANTEFCGYLGLNPAGTIVTSAISQGTEASCRLPDVPAGMTLLASFHTHSTYSPEYASEFPTTTDMLSDQADNIDGYISTPGGRLWYVDSDTMTVRQLCGRGCLPQDPGYVAADDGPVRDLFTLADLQRLENG